MAKINGIDVSSWQGVIDWEKAKADGVQFAIIREGYGKANPKQVDKYFHKNMQEAQKHGIPCGVYHYSYADSVEDARAEAAFCLDNIKGYKLEYPVCFDIEDKEQLKLNDRQRTDICKAFCDEIEKAGYYAMIYCNLNWINNYLIKDELLGRYDLWLAQWYVDAPSIPCGIWQKSEKGTINGISGNVDLNEAFNDYPAIIKEKGLNGFNAQKTVQAATTAKPKEEHTTTYTIKTGDTLSAIAEKYKTTYQHLAEINGITDPNLIYAGQVIKVPSNYDACKYSLYTVKSGDSLWSIAEKLLGNGAKYKEIKAFNGLTSDTIYAGQTLKIK